MRRIMTSIAVFTLSVAAIFAADDKSISGEYTYYGTPGMSMAEAKDKALAAAQNEAIRKEFGTLVSQDIVQTSEIANDRDKQAFLSSTQSTVRGEWLATTGTPTFEERYENGCPVVTCKVSGRGRKLSNKAPDINVAVLSAPDKRSVNSSFKDGDDVFMYIQSPESDIYAMVCLQGEDGTVVRMFPYLDTPQKLASLKKGYDYILFDTNRPGGDFGTVDGFEMRAANLELDRLYVLYSPNYYRRGPWIHDGDDTPEYMSEKDFNKWMLDLRRADEEMGMKVMVISVSPKRDKNYDYE